MSIIICYKDTNNYLSCDVLISGMACIKCCIVSQILISTATRPWHTWEIWKSSCPWARNIEIHAATSSFFEFSLDCVDFTNNISRNTITSNIIFPLCRSELGLTHSSTISNVETTHTIRWLILVLDLKIFFHENHDTFIVIIKTLGNL